VQQVKEGNKHLIGTMPMEMLKAMKAKKTFKFADGQIFHLKVPGLPALSRSGASPITSAIKLFLFAAILRRANEAIALEHITPFRVIHPQAASGNGDPLLQLNLDEWRRELESNYKKFRRDPLRMQFSPVPIGVQNVGGDGRAMLTLGELQEAEKISFYRWACPWSSWRRARADARRGHATHAGKPAADAHRRPERPDPVDRREMRALSGVGLYPHAAGRIQAARRC
jgi:hypothetical protein